MTTSLAAATVLVLNKNWQAITTTSPRNVFASLAQDHARALRIEGPDWIEPIKWDDWISLPIRPQDRVVGTPSGGIRIPTVVVLSTFDQLPRRRLRFNFRGLWQRDGGRCQYTGRQLIPSEANIDHVIPRSRGGADSWENCVLSCRDVNTRKADRTPAEANLTLLQSPTKPPVQPATNLISNPYKISDWQHFLPAS